MDFEHLQVTFENGIAIIAINRPEVRNAMDLKTVTELQKALEGLASDSKIGVVILTGAGEKVFVSGADIRDLKVRTKFDALRLINSNLCTAVEKFEKPVIAAVNGYALGGGCELAMACDIRVSSENAHYGLPETGLGIVPAAGGTQRLPRLVGWGKAKELILTGEIIDAHEAERIGLVNKVVPHERLMDEAKEVARKILSRAPLATRLAKLSMNMASQVSQDSGLMFETLAQAILFESKDKLEGMSAFLEKRNPRFKGQ